MENYLRKLWVYLDKNQTVKGLFLIGVVLLGGFGVWEGLRLGLNTEFPVLVVSSGSMIPTLQIGDLIVIRGQDPSTIRAGPPPVGSIIVFRPPCCSLSLNDPNYLVVHRVVEIQNGHFVTRGDNNGGVYDPWDPQSGGPGVPPSNVVGVYQSTIPIPYLGSTILSIRGFMSVDTTGQPRPEGIAIIAVLVIALFAIDVISPSKKDKKPSSTPAPTSTPAEPPQNAVHCE